MDYDFAESISTTRSRTRWRRFHRKEHPQTSENLEQILDGTSGTNGTNEMGENEHDRKLVLNCIRTRFCRLRPRPRTRTRPSRHSTTRPTTGWLFASGSSWTLGHTCGSRQDTHGTPVPAREGRGWPTTCSTPLHDRRPPDRRQSLVTNVLSANRRQDKRAVQQPGADSHLESYMVAEQRDEHVASAQ